MAAPAAPVTPRLSLLGRLVGGLTQYIATPIRASPPQEAQPASAQANFPAFAHVEAQQTPPASEDWHPGMIQTKYLSEYANMFDDIINTPQRHVIRRSQTTPRKQRITRAHAVQMPRSAMKKRPTPGDEEETTTTSNKRVKFNDRLVQERILSPPHPGERDSFPETCNFNSKKRPRATDPYMGKQFEDSPNMFDESPSKRARYDSGEESTADSENTPTTQNNTRMNAGLREEPFVPNRAQPRPGTFELNYDTYAGDDESLLSEEKNEISPGEQTPAFNPPSTNSIPGRYALEFSDDSTNADESSLVNDNTPTPGPSQRPARIESPPALEPPTPQNEEQINQLEIADDQPPTPPTPPNAAEIDAEMEALPWPEPVTYVDAGIASQHVIDLLNERYDEDDDYYAGLWWDREYSKFSNALKTAKAEGREIQIEY
jgi:hypothetical protein